MGFLDSLGRFFSSAFGLAEGKTQRMADKMVTSNADAIRSQFRKTKEDWSKDYQEMREAVAELIRIREMKSEEVKKISKESEELQQKMSGAIELYKKTPDERYKAAYAQLAEKSEKNEQRVKELEAEIDEQQQAIERYKVRLLELQTQIDSLNKEEAETVADIISSQKIKELNDRLSGLSVDSSSKNLEAIRNARQKSKAVAKLSTELTGAEKTDLDKELSQAGSRSKHLSAFEDAIGVNKITLKSDPFASLPSQTSAPFTKKDTIDVELSKLTSGLNK
ncbi:PspA/IM30 family protein [Fluviispira multicolorata]|nr:PspA/IM30 family protein [Fluviispira multicolorata]